MSCEPEKVTGYVDGVLDPETRAAVEEHLATCAECRTQADEERELRAELSTLPHPEPRPGFEQRLRTALAPARRPHYWGAYVAAALIAIVLWARGAPPFVAFEISRDHAHCFGAARLPAKVWSDDPQVVTRWFEDQGTSLPVVPATAGGLSLVGARYCPLMDRVAAHLYYADGDRHASLFVLRGPARFQDGYETRIVGQTVLLFRSAGTTVGVVADRTEDAEALHRKFTTTFAFAVGPGAFDRARPR